MQQNLKETSKLKKMHFNLALSLVSYNETSRFLFWPPLQEQAPQPKQLSCLVKTGPEVTMVFEVLTPLENRYCANAQIPAWILCVCTPACAHMCTVKTGVLQTCSNHKESQKEIARLRDIQKSLSLIYLFLFETRQSYMILLGTFPCAVCFQARHGRNQRNQTLVCFRYFLKATWAIEFKDKVKAKSIPIRVFTGLCRRFQSNESDDKCTATLDTIL